ncbi:MAG: hypothetical protein HYW07_24590 [Candidatus Latescibacteria bacterium]|nr:hypothetical protein [Candidatus Latescibacterota bacterium]
MIRIQLQPRSRRLFPVFFLGMGVFLATALGLAYLAREEHPSPLPALAAVELPAQAAEQPQEPAPQTAPPVVPQDRAPALPPSTEAQPPQREEVRPAQPQQSAPAPAKGQRQIPALPQAGPLCLRTLQLYERLPPAVRCSSLSGTGSGEYTIEGTIPAGDFPQLIALLDGLQRLSSRATLSGGLAGKKEGDYGFNLHGQFAPEAQPAAAPLGTGEVAALFTQAAALARKSRLDSVRVGSPLFTPLAKGVVQQRQKLWATGSYQQLKTFVGTLVRQQPQLHLEEVMLVPQYRGEAQWKQAQFYAVLSAAVRAAR